jgi:hypothetical protein
VSDIEAEAILGLHFKPDGASWFSVGPSAR